MTIPTPFLRSLADGERAHREWLALHTTRPWSRQMNHPTDAADALMAGVESQIRLLENYCELDTAVIDLFRMFSQRDHMARAYSDHLLKEIEALKRRIARLESAANERG